MTAVVVNHTIEQGATFIYAFQWLSPGPDPETPGPANDLTGYVARMQIRKKQKTPTLVDATTTNGKIILGEDYESTVTDDPTTGWVKIVLSDEDTDLLTSSTALYDLEVEDPLGRVYRLIKGKITVDPNITQNSDDPEVTD